MQASRPINNQVTINLNTDNRSKNLQTNFNQKASGQSSSYRERQLKHHEERLKHHKQEAERHQNIIEHIKRRIASDKNETIQKQQANQPVIIKSTKIGDSSSLYCTCTQANTNLAKKNIYICSNCDTCHRFDCDESMVNSHQDLIDLPYEQRLCSPCECKLIKGRANLIRLCQNNWA